MPPKKNTDKQIDENLLIDLYRKNEALWNPGNPDYSKDTSPLWEEIATVFHGKSTIAELKSKINSLRTSYNNYKKKPPTGSTARNPRVSTLQKMARLSFLDVVFTSTNSFSNLNTEEQNTGQQYSEELAEDFDEYSQDENAHTEMEPDDLELHDIEAEDYNPQIRTPSQSASPYPRQPTPQYTKKRKLTLAEKNEATRMELLKTAVGTLSQTDAPKDKYAIFGELVAAGLREMSRQKADETQLQIQTVLYKMKYGQEVQGSQE